MREERRQVIMEMAWHMFQASSYDDVIMLDIAKALGLVKATLYRCFRSKEELFLAVLERQLSLWFSEIDSWLADVPASSSIMHITALLSQSLDTRPALLRLLAIRHTTLERKAELASVLRFRRLFAERIAETGARLENCLPFLASGQGARLLIQYHALAIGLWQCYDAAPAVRQALPETEQTPFDRQFSSDFSDLLYALLVGLDCQAQGG